VLQNVLKAWSELGAQDPEKLKKLLVERRLKTFQGLLLQTVLDFVACGGEWVLKAGPIQQTGLQLTVQIVWLICVAQLRCHISKTATVAAVSHAGGFCRDQGSGIDA
jgi:hypothetical protein